MEKEKFVTNFKNIFDEIPESISLQTNFREIEGWDSLIYLSLIVMIEEEYSYRISSKELSMCKSLEDIWNIIEKK
jgi:acyl carrier protein